MFTFRSGHELQHKKTQNCLLQLTEQFIVLYCHVKLLKNVSFAWSYCRISFKDLGPVQTPNLTDCFKYLKGSASESIGNAYFNLERLSRSSRLAQQRISTLDRLWNGLDSVAEFFMCRI